MKSKIHELLNILINVVSKTLKNDWLIWLIILSPLLLLTQWNSFPEQIPTHWSKGKIDDYQNKGTAFLFFLGTNIFMYLVFLVVPILDPKRKNYELFADKYKILRLVMHLFIGTLPFISFFVALGYPLNVEMLTQIGVVLLMLVLGNFMGNIRHNYFVGIRVPWTLANEQVWTLTHRFAGKLWVTVSLFMLPVCFFVKSDSTVIFYIYIGIITVIPIAYSFIKFRQISSGKEA